MLKKEKFTSKDKFNHITSLYELKLNLSKDINPIISLLNQPKLNFQLENYPLHYHHEINHQNIYQNNKDVQRTKDKKITKNNKEKIYKNDSMMNTIKQGIKSGIKSRNTKSQQSLSNSQDQQSQIKINYSLIRQSINTFADIKQTPKLNNKNQTLQPSLFIEVFDQPFNNNKQNLCKQSSNITTQSNKKAHSIKKAFHSKSFIIKENKRNSEMQSHQIHNKISYNSFSCKKSIQRRKYEELRNKMQDMLKAIQSTDKITFSEVFDVQQLVIKKFLSEYIQEIKKQCIEKGEFVELIWNSFFELINRIMKMLTEKAREVQRSQVKNSLLLHEEYQQLYINSQNKVKQLGRKYNQLKNVIDRLIFELRYKRKQTKKLYRNMAFCNDQMILYKQEYVQLQNYHIELLMQTKLINKQSAMQLIQKRDQINRNLQQSKKMRITKQRIKQEILRQMNEEKIILSEEIKIKDELIEKVNQQFALMCSGNMKKFIINEDQVAQTALVDQFIEKFSSKCLPLEDNLEKDVGLGLLDIKSKNKENVSVNTDFQFKLKVETNSVFVQTTFSDKIQNQLVRSYPTQTPGPKVKKVQSVQIQADGDQMKLILTKSRMISYRVYDMSFCFEKSFKRASNSLIIGNANKMLGGGYSTNNFKVDEILQDYNDNDNDGEQVSSQQRGISKSTLQIQEKMNRNNEKSGFRKNRNSIFSQSRNNNRTKSSQAFIQRSAKEKKNSAIEQNKYSNKDQNINIDREQIIIKRSFHKARTAQKSNFFSNEDTLHRRQTKQQRQIYIESIVANKKQEFDIVDSKSMFQSFKDTLLNQIEEKKSSFVKQIHESQVQNSKERGNLYMKNKQRQSLMKKNQEEILKKKIQLNKQQKQSTRRSILLNKIVELSVKKSMVRKQLDESNFQACKQKSEYFSITQKLDPFLLDVDCLLNSQLGKGKRNSGLQMNPKTANKYIMMAYSKAIDKIYRNTVILQNLIKPLYESFQLTYGALKPMQIYRKMISFISYVISSRQQNENFADFIFFMGLDDKKPTSGYLTTFDVCLFLKIVEKLNLGTKITSQIQTVYTSKKKVNQELLNLLISQNISYEVSKKVTTRIQTILQKLDEFVKESVQSGSEMENKINVFKVSRMIVQEIIKIRMSLVKKLQIYTGNETIAEPNQLRKIKNEKFEIELIERVIQNCQITSLHKIYFSRAVHQLSIVENEVNMIKKNQLSVLLLKIGIINFDYLDLRIKQSAEIRKKLKIDYQSENISPLSTPGKSQKKQKKIKQLVEIENLYMIQVKVEELVNEIAGEVGFLNSIGLLKLLEHSNSKLSK